MPVVPESRVGVVDQSAAPVPASWLEFDLKGGHGEHLLPFPAL